MLVFSMVMHELSYKIQLSQYGTAKETQKTMDQFRSINCQRSNFYNWSQA
jgi:hypothetical protein